MPSLDLLKVQPTAPQPKNDSTTLGFLAQPGIPGPAWSTIDLTGFTGTLLLSIRVAQFCGMAPRVTMCRSASLTTIYVLLVCWFRLPMVNLTKKWF